MSKAFKVVLILLLLATGGYFVNEYLKDKVPSLTIDLNDKNDRELFNTFLTKNDRGVLYCDLTLTKEQNEEFMLEQNRSNYIHIGTSKKVEYIFITREDGKREYIYDKDRAKLEGLFVVEVVKNDENRSVIKLLSITPSDLKILNN